VIARMDRLDNSAVCICTLCNFSTPVAYLLVLRQ
jgi:hypothetical protein